MLDFCPKTRAFKEKTARKACRLSRIFDAESAVLGQNRRRFGVFKQTLGSAAQITWKVFHFPDRSRSVNITARTTQSRHMAAAMPTTPQFRTTASRMENASRPPMVEAMDTTMVNLISPAARRPLESGPDMGKATVLNTLPPGQCTG